MGSPGRHGYTRVLRGGRTSKVGDWGREGTPEETWSCPGVLRARAVSRNLEGVGVLWGTWPHIGELRGGSFMQKSGPQIFLDAKTETSTAESWSE